MHGRFHAPSLKEFPPVAVCPIPTPIFTSVLDHCTTETWVPSNFQYFPCGRDPFSDRDGIVLAKFSCMVWICQHCGAPFVDSPYRVKREESGVVFLDLIVCHGCYVQARELGLPAEEIGVRYRFPAQTAAAQEKKPTLRR